MEHKIGEIFEYNGEWYQCVKADPIINADGIINYCEGCSIAASECNNFNCTDDERSDKELVIFKKLEKVGEPFIVVGKLYQYYKVFDIDNVCGDGSWCIYNYKEKTLTIEIKQNKEDMEEEKHSNSENIGKNLKPNEKDMEENKTTFPKESNALTRTVFDYLTGKISDKGFIRSIKEMSDEYPYAKSSLKPFDLQAAKSGKPVCTRDGRKARIICFDRVTNSTNEYTGSLVVLITNLNGDEQSWYYTNNGVLAGRDEYDNQKWDLMMIPEKKEGWVNLYRDEESKRVYCGEFIFSEREKAEKHYECNDTKVATVPVNWEE